MKKVKKVITLKPSQRVKYAVTPQTRERGRREERRLIKENRILRAKIKKIKTLAGLRTLSE